MLILENHTHAKPSIMKHFPWLFALLFSMPVLAQFTEVQTIVPTHNGTLLQFGYRAYVDLNNDGFKDLVLQDSWLPAIDDQSFDEPILFDSSYRFYEFFPLDYDEDGDIDLLPRLLQRPDDVTVAGLLVLENDGIGNLSLELIGAGALISLHDVNGDDHLDFLISRGSELLWLLYDEGYSDENTISITPFQGLGQLVLPAVGDLNNDSFPDLVLASYVIEIGGGITVAAPLEIKALLSQASLEYELSDLLVEEPTTVVNGQGFWELAASRQTMVQDFDQDGNLDIVYGHERNWSMLRGDGTGEFYSPNTVLSSSDVGVMIESADGPLIGCYNNGRGNVLPGDPMIIEIVNFKYPSDLELGFRIGGQFGQVYADDILGLGSDQLIITNQDRCEIRVYLRQEDGSWQDLLLYSAPNCRYGALAFRDQNSDGLTDILLSHVRSYLIDTKLNGGGLDFGQDGFRYSAEVNTSMAVVDGHLLVTEGIIGENYLLKELITNEEGQYIGVDTLAIAPPYDAGLPRIRAICKNFFENGDLNVLTVTDSSMIVRSVTGDLSNQTSVAFAHFSSYPKFARFDQDNDGDEDFYYLVPAEGQRNGLYFFENLSGTLAEPVFFEADRDLYQAFAFNLNGDGLADFFARDVDNNLITIAQLPDGSLAFQQELEQNIQYIRPRIFDADLDGDSDVAIQYRLITGGNIAKLFMTDSLAQMHAHDLIVADALTSSFQVADLVGDEQLELVQISHAPENSLRIYTNDNSSTALGPAFMESNNTGISFYPNPVHDQMNITGLHQPAQYKLYDLLGRMLAEGAIDPKHAVLDLRWLSQGIYTLELETEELKQSFRFIRALDRE